MRESTGVKFSLGQIVATPRALGALQRAGHYLGSTKNLTKRLAEHEHGGGARLLEVVHAAGISWKLARTWDGGREQERRLKRQKNGARLCPICEGRRPAPPPSKTPTSPTVTPLCEGH